MAHDHDHDEGSTLSEMDLRVRALETILVEKGYIESAALDRIVELYETKIGPHLGAQVIGTASSEDKARVAREYGCADVIVSRDYRFADAVQRLGGADVIVDGLGDAAREENYAALARRGHWISVGQATGAMQPLSPEQLAMKSATFSRPGVAARAPASLDTREANAA